MKEINIEYFAILRDEAGCEKELLQVECESLRELYIYLKNKYGFSLPIEMIQVAQNDQFALMTSKLNHKDKIVFIPPVAGG